MPIYSELDSRKTRSKLLDVPSAEDLLASSGKRAPNITQKDVDTASVAVVLSKTKAAVDDLEMIRELGFRRIDTGDLRPNWGSAGQLVPATYKPNAIDAARTAAEIGANIVLEVNFANPELYSNDKVRAGVYAAKQLTEGLLGISPIPKDKMHELKGKMMDGMRQVFEATHSSPVSMHGMSGEDINLEEYIKERSKEIDGGIKHAPSAKANRHSAPEVTAPSIPNQPGQNRNNQR